jgi:glycerophosphoryl diester phosphodiesterase
MYVPIVIAHRGDSSQAIENSLEAVRLALSLPVDMVEIDIRKSLDNALYVMHDKHTGRTADKNVDIEQSGPMRYQGKVENGEPIPTLKDVLSLFTGNAGLNLEIKSEGAGRLAAEHLRDSGYRGPVLISSFLENEILAVRGVAPFISTSGIFDTFTVQNLTAYHSKRYSLISLRKKTVSKELIIACHNHGIKVYVWTVDDEADMEKFIAWESGRVYQQTFCVKSCCWFTEVRRTRMSRTIIKQDHLFRLIVIGGGITGAGTARDAALRGLSCLLLEKGDFASGVTSKSTRLIHGGLRYLANFEVDLVAESLREREILRRQAPYLIHPMPILIPIYKGDPHNRAVISIGIHLYDMLSHEKDLPHYFTSGSEKTLRFEPRLSRDGLMGSAFYDRRF